MSLGDRDAFNSASPQQRLEQVIAAYLRAAELGMPVDREELVARHADLADHLRAFFAAHDQERHLADQTGHDAPSLPAATPTGDLAKDATLPLAPKTLPPNDFLPAAPSAFHAPNSVLGRVRCFGDYELLEEIARGGMGVILRAFDPDIRREVAVKFLLNQADQGQRTRFLEEAQITGQLEHPNIVPIHQLGDHNDGRCFFSMKMVKGRSLADILPTHTQADGSSEFTLGRLLNVFNNICNALGYAHSRQVIHRDLKPANIMVGDFGEVYVMDWGLAKVMGKESGSTGQESTITSPKSGALPSKVATSRPLGSSLTQAGAIMGTPAYMPPEQALGEGEGEAIDQRSDVYALGAILYEMLTLSPPVGREGDLLAVLMRVVEGAIQPPEQQAPERARQGLIPPELSAIALKALAKDPADRYQTVEALQRDIQLYLEGRAVSAKRDTAWETIKKLVRRNKGASIATAVALLLLTVGAGVAFYFINRERQEAVTARDKAQDNYQAFKDEQEKRLQQGRDSIPSLLTAGKLLLEKRDFDGARAQVRVALDFDPDHAELRYLKGQLALVAQDFAQAQTELETYAKQRPDDLLARDLLAFLPRAKANDTDTQVLLAEICSRHMAHALADGVLQALGENAPAAREKLLALYRQRVEEKWTGRGKSLTLDKGKGTFHLSFFRYKELTDLSTLQGLPLTTLNLDTCEQVRDLRPLAGMPLTWLNLSFCPQVQSLEPLQGMPLTHLDLWGCAEVTDIRPLQGMKLTWLRLRSTIKVTDLEPLRGMPLTELYIMGMKLDSIEPLTGMSLKKLDLAGSEFIKDLTPLRDMPLEWLSLGGIRGLRDFEPLRGRPLTFLDMYQGAIRDLDVLKDMPLRWLNLAACGNVDDLTPLAGMKLTYLNLNGLNRVESVQALHDMPLEELHLGDCKKIRDFEPLKGLPLKKLAMAGCAQLASLNFLRGMNRLDLLDIRDCKQLQDLGPLKNLKLRTIYLTPELIDENNMKLLRGLNLDWVGVSANVSYPVRDFWKKWDAGEFKK